MNSIDGQIYIPLVKLDKFRFMCTTDNQTQWGEFIYKGELLSNIPFT